ncbi:dihydrofolate reductase-like domain-containing protein, partial [Tribonema minus]
RPFVTLTYAQSLDGSIASADKRPVRISGRASRIMTHGLRSLHDGILVGGGTVRRDNPRLNVREWVGDSGDSQDPPPCPRPIVLSSQMGLPMAIKAHGAVIFTSFCRAETQSWLAARAHGGGGDASDCVIVHCATAAGGCCDLRDCLARLAAMGFASVMVEGGGRIIRAFLQAGLVDRLVVTVAPLMLGGYT